MIEIEMLAVFVAVLLIGLCTVPIVRGIALEYRFVDNPDRQRKLHKAPIALGGGAAVWLATWCGWGVWRYQFSTQVRDGEDSGWFLPALGFSTLLILVLGIIDDRVCLRGRHKLAGQAVATAILVALGLRIDALSCFGVHWNLGMLAYPLTVFWILLVINAFNLIDGMDGFCGSIGLIASLAIAFLGYRSGRVEDAMVALALAGASAAFLRYNLPPAKIYLGDAGSMTIGMLIAALSIRCCTNGAGTSVSMLPVMAISTLPVLDVTAAVCRRWLRGRSIFTPDCGHIHHRLRNRLGSTLTALVVAIPISVLGAVGAVSTVAYEMGDIACCVVIALAVGVLVGTNCFGANELRLLLFRIKVVLAPFAKGLVARGQGVGQECHVHGERNWADVWGALVREGEALGVSRIELAIDMTAAGEIYHGHWTSATTGATEPHWSIVHTLYAGDLEAGTITVAGNTENRGLSYLNRVEKVIRVVEDRLAFEREPIPPSEAASVPSVNLAVNSALT